MTNTVPCLLLPLNNINVLVPSSVVAEVIPFEEPKSISDSPNWLLGILSWRGIHIPLVLLEQMESYLKWNTSNSKTLEKKDHLYIAILNRINKVDSQRQKINYYPFFAIVLQRAPKLFRVTKDGIELVGKAKAGEIRFLMEIRVQHEPAYVPNINNFWQIIDTLPSRLQWFRPIIL